MHLNYLLTSLYVIRVILGKDLSTELDSLKAGGEVKQRRNGNIQRRMRRPARVVTSGPSAIVKQICKEFPFPNRPVLIA